MESTAAEQREQPSGREVFEILAREHADMLTGYLRSLLRSSTAVDYLFQEAMLTAWRRLDDYDRDRPFGPWLRGIAARLVWKHRERSARDVLNCDSEVLAALEQRFRDVSSYPESFRDNVHHLVECLRRLPEKLKAAIELAYHEGLRLRTVARRLGVSEEAIKKRIQRGRQMLAECIRRREAVS